MLPTRKRGKKSMEQAMSLHRACIRSSDAAPSSMKLIARLLELGGRDLTNLVFYEHPILVRRPYTALLYACLNKSPTNEIF